MPINAFRQRLNQDNLTLADTLSFIARHYEFSPTAFSNGALINHKGQNEGSCKILALAILEQLSEQEALQAFGEHYRHVLQTPEGTDHLNIRQLLKTGLSTVQFAHFPLQRKASE